MLFGGGRRQKRNSFKSLKNNDGKNSKLQKAQECGNNSPSRTRKKKLNILLQTVKVDNSNRKLKLLNTELA